MTKFDTTQNTQFVVDAVSMNINELSPKLKEMMSLKYKKSNIFFDEDDDTYHLVQEARTIESMEYDLVEPEVVTFNLNPGQTNVPPPQTKMQTIEAPKKKLIIESGSFSA
jgi:hypothetical protein